MVNSRASRATLLYSKTLASTSTSETFTPTVAITESKYAKLLILINGLNTATLILQLKISAKTAYNLHEILNDSGTLSGTLTGSATQIDLIPITLLDEARYFSFSGEITFAGTQLMLHGQGVAGGEGNNVISAEIPSTTTISSIEIKVSTSSLAAGTIIKIWGLK